MTIRLWKVINLGARAAKRSALCLAGLAAMLNVGPAATMAGSVLLSLAVYAIAFGFKFAIGFVILLFLHEAGHLIAARVVGLRATGPIFVPFIGAVIHLRQSPHNAKMEANVAIGGPALGTLSALLCLILYFWTESMLMLVLAYTGCLLNLFNLIPCTPLDGGRIAAAISPHLWRLGSVALGILGLYTHNILILVIFLCSLLRLWQGDTNDQHETYYHLTMAQRVKVALWYFGLLFVLGFMTIYLVELLR